MMDMKPCLVHKIAFVLLVIGGINWGLVGFFQWPLVEVVLGQWPVAVSLVYDLIGLSAVAMLFCCHCKACKMGKK